VVISDLHLGVYKDRFFLERVVEKINKINRVDYVIIPGDFVYYPYKNLNETFGALSKLKCPCYAVFGNHDIQEESYIKDLKPNLIKTLNKNGVTFLHNESIYIEKFNINILGLGDHMSKEDNIELIDKFDAKDRLIVIAHNPDTTLKYSNKNAKLTICGHTHGGQIRIPFLYKKNIPCKGDFDQGLYDTKHGKVFVSSGIGEVLLPIRLGIPPSIDVLDLS